MRPLPQGHDHPSGRAARADLLEAREQVSKTIRYIPGLDIRRARRVARMARRARIYRQEEPA